MFVRSFLIVTLLPFQSCSNTQIGEKLENSFEITENSIDAVKSIKKKNQTDQIKETKSRKKLEKSEDNMRIIIQEDSISNKDRSSQNTTKLLNKEIFDPQPYRIILKLSGANPSAPAESVTKALRKAGVKFEVEKIERVAEGNIFKNKSLKNKNLDF